MAERLIPGDGYIQETATAQRLLPGYGVVNETVPVGGTAPTLSALTASLITSSGCRATVQVAR